MTHFQFISQAQDISLRDVAPRLSTLEAPEQLILEAPFHFIISRMVARFDPESPEQCLQLPPSLELGDLIIDGATGHRYAQPSITYYLRAAVTFRTRAGNARMSQETSLPVVITPHTEELPPTETNDFPAEFREQETKIMRRFLMGTTLGALKISLGEPPPLTYHDGSEHSSTGALMRLEFVPTSSSSTSKLPHGLTFTVYSLVRVKTFYSVKGFPGLPSQGLLGVDTDTRLRDDIVKLETQTVTNASWGYRFNIGRQSSEGLLNSISQNGVFNGRLNDEAVSHPSNLEPKTTAPNGRWISNWTIPIEVDGRLLPTFCSALVARRYSLIVPVRVGGVRQERFDLEVPLQVIHSSPRTVQSTTGDPATEAFLEPRRASETSWFSDESLVRYLFPEA